MLNVKYYKDYRHNYLIIKCEDNCKENTYQRKMITANSIKGLLGCQERYVNGDMLLYYEITSRQNLAGLYSVKCLSWDMLHKFFRQLKLVSDLLQKYLLDESKLILQPEYIFFNLEAEEFSFLYYPEAKESSFMKLMDFFTARVDEEDIQAVEIIYKIADLIHRDQFVLDEILDWFQESEEKQEIRKNTDWQTNTEIPNQDYTTNRNAYERKNEEWEQEEDTFFDDHRKWAVLPLGIGGVLAGILLYVNYCYRIGDVEKIWYVAGWCTAIMFVVGAAFWYIYQTYKMEKCNIGNQNSNLGKDSRMQPREYAEPFAYDLQKPSAPECGNTVFIPWIDGCENRLHGMGKGNKYHIDLNNLPITVGKMAGAVDVLLSDQSISRMHAKFSRVGSKICITDLNSTNGTFKNGLRLAPNDSEMIEPGDEIRIGKLKFIYR